MLIQRAIQFALYALPVDRGGGRGEPWNDDEVLATVRDYFDMLRLELDGRPYVKAEHSRELARVLNGRTKGAIEQKHMNISAILQELGYPYINGYKPLKNYQQLLKQTVEEQIRLLPWLPRADVRRTGSR